MENVKIPTDKQVQGAVEEFRADLRADIIKVKTYLAECDSDEVSMAYFKLLMLLNVWLRTDAG